MSRNEMLVVWATVVFLLSFGLVVPSSAQTSAGGSPDNGPMLSCSPAPCVFAPEFVPSAGNPLWSNVVDANPNNSAQLVVATIDSQCASGESLSSTPDDGASWTSNCLPLVANNSSGQRALLAYGSSGVVYAGTDQLQKDSPYREQIVISSSTDNGLTWTVPKPAVSAYGAYAMGMKVDNSSASPFVGSLYIAGGLLYYSDEIVISHSRDGAKTWSTTVVDRRTYPLVDYFPSVAIAADGTVYATWLLCKEKPVLPEDSVCGGQIADIMFAKSSDGGSTWSTPLAISHPRLAPASEYGLWGVLPFSGVSASEIPVLSVDNSNGPNAGNIYVCFYHNAGTYLQVAVITSRDQGQTWSSPVSVSSLRPGDQFNPWVSVSSTGTVGVTWLQGQLGSDKYQPFFAVSTDGGVTFTGEHSLDNGLSNPSANPNAFGEYRTHVWIGNALYALWQDNHTGGSNFQVAIGGVQF